MDIRWKQRFFNFKKAFEQLTEFIEKGDLNKFEKQGLIKCFEYSHELAWNVLKDYLSDEGIQGLIGSKSSTREAFRLGLIHNGQVWMDMIESRNQSVHTYDENSAHKLASLIVLKYYGELKDFYLKMEELL